MMSKLLMIVSVLVATGTVGYIGYDQWRKTSKPSPVAIGNDSVGCIAESYASMDEWSALNRAFIMVKEAQTEEVAKLCGDSGMTVVSKHKRDESDFTLLICVWNEEINNQKMDVIQNHPAVEFIDVHAQPRKEQDQKVKSWDLKSWIDPLEENVEPKGSEDGQHDSTTHKERVD